MSIFFTSQINSTHLVVWGQIHTSETKRDIFFPTNVLQYFYIRPQMLETGEIQHSLAIMVKGKAGRGDEKKKITCASPPLLPPAEVLSPLHVLCVFPAHFKVQPQNVYSEAFLTTSYFQKLSPCFVPPIVLYTFIIALCTLYSDYFCLCHHSC